MTTTDTPTETILSPEYRGFTVAILTIVALSAFEGLAVAAALPQVAADLGGVALLPWVVTVFLLTVGVATIVAGAMVDRVGAGRTFRVSVVVFVLGGVAAGLAPSIEVLLAARVVQGIGAGATNAVALAAVGLVLPERLVGRAFAANATVWGVMSVAGPAIAAAMLTVASWRWIFLVNLPLGGAALALGWRQLPDRPAVEGGVQGRIDPLNLTLLTVFSVASLVALDQLGWTSVPAVVLALAAGWLVLRRTEGRADALVAPRHVVRAPFGPLAWGIALLLVGAIGTQSYVPLYISAGRGVSPALTAWSVLFFTLGWTSGAQLSSRLMDRLGAMRVTTIGSLVVPPGTAAVGVAALLGAPLWVLFIALFVAGTGMGAATNSGLTLLRSLAPDAELGRATAAHQYVRSQGFAGGAALGGAVLLLVVATRTGDVEAVRGLLGEGGGGGALDPTLAAAVADGFGIAALAGAAVASLAQLPFAALRRHDRRLAAAGASPEPLPAPVD
jgi:MFS family permease